VQPSLPIHLDHRVRIDVTAATRQVNAALGELLAGFSEEDWQRPTIHAARSVKDLTAHLLHGSLRRVTGMRDHYHRAVGPFASAAELTAFIQRDNRDFMQGMAGISPAILRELIERYDREATELLERGEPDAPGLGVVWAGEWTSPHWFDVAREYTEKWHHQQQLRDAVGAPALYQPELLAPLYETFARGLPHAYASFAAAEDTRISLVVEAPADTAWTLRRSDGAWQLWRGRDPGAAATLHFPADLAWRLWTRGLDAAEARRAVRVESGSADGGAAALEPALAFVAIMA
jgi:Mycothiol maleylpyruvate isomerase N-terminal domain